MYKGYKIKKDKYTLEVEKVEKVAENLYYVYYVIKEGNRKIMSNFAFVTRENCSKLLNDALNKIVRGLKSVEEW